MEWIALIIIGVIIIILNGWILYSFFTDRSLFDRPPNHLFCNLACSDVLTAVVFVPFQVAEGFVPRLHVTPYIISYIFFTSLLSLLFLTSERHLAVTRPTLHIRLASMFRLRNVFLISWLSPLIPTLLPLAWTFLNEEKQNTPTFIFQVCLWIIILLFCVVMLFMYTEMFLRVREYFKTMANMRQPESTSENQSTTNSRMEVRVIVLLSFLMLAFLLAYIPILYINLASSVLKKNHLVTTELVRFSLYTFLLNSVFNPLLAMALKHDIRKGVTRSARNLLTRQSNEPSTWRMRFRTKQQAEEASIALEQTQCETNHI